MPSTGSPAYRPLNILGFICSGVGLVYAVSILEPLLGNSNCLFCSLIRALLLSLSLIYLLALIHNPASAGQRSYALLGLLLIATGLFTLGYQGWSQTNAPALTDAELLTCQMSLEQLNLQGTLTDKLGTWFTLATRCPVPRPGSAALSINLQTLILFTLLLLLNLRLIMIKPRRQGYFV
ncbi:disulfide bond formation protein B [Pontibacter sp. JAM-7]|uniref:disulfide bond formation protein B n=1 Tax=Pontibacter sp. JAM-7 TaxID=3366581 RepID=UPI003AF97499